MTQLIPFEGTTPVLAEDSWVAPGATLVGAVTLGPKASVWFGAVIRADGDTIEVGEASNVPAGAVRHAAPGFPLTTGRGGSVGHAAVLHGCTIEDDVLVGMSATVLNGARIGRGSLVAAGTVVLEGTVVPPRSLVAGVPGKVRRPLTDAEYDRVVANAQIYLELSTRHRQVSG